MSLTSQPQAHNYAIDLGKHFQGPGTALVRWNFLQDVEIHMVYTRTRHIVVDAFTEQEHDTSPCLTS
jgi:hypothetical protein